MFRSTIPAGRWLGVDIRFHMALPALLLVAGAASVLDTGQAARGFGLWSILLFAVLVREGARILVLAWNGLSPRALVLFPFGGVVAFARPAPHHPPDGGPDGSQATPRRALLIVPLLANFLTAGLLLGFSYAIAPGVRLFVAPWISLHHLLRSAVWTQFFLGALNLVPAASVRMPKPLRFSRPGRTRRSGTGPSIGFANSLGLLLMLAGFALMNLWFVALGCLLLLAGRLQSGEAPTHDQFAGMPIREAMLTAYDTLPNAGLLSEALESTSHSTQPIFPVLQGDTLVGAISRAAMNRRFQAEGDGYVQRDMVRRLPLADSTEIVTDALRRAEALGGGDLVPVVAGNRVLGILTPQSLSDALDRRRNPPSRPTPVAHPQPAVSPEELTTEN